MLNDNLLGCVSSKLTGTVIIKNQLNWGCSSSSDLTVWIIVLIFIFAYFKIKQGSICDTSSTIFYSRVVNFFFMYLYFFLLLLYPPHIFKTPDFKEMVLWKTDI